MGITHNNKCMDSKEMIKYLIKDGWVKIHQKGSHQQFVHPTKKGKVTVPYRITKNIEKSILKQAGL